MIKLRKMLGGMLAILAFITLVLLFCSSPRYTAQLYIDDAFVAASYLFATAQCIVIFLIGGMLLGD